MGQSSNTSKRHSWGSPPCPDCGSDVYVDRTSKTHEYLCQLCGMAFDG